MRPYARDNIGYYAGHLFETRPEKKTEPVKLYYVRLYNDVESFYKIGLTKRADVKHRFYGIPYNVEVITVEGGILYDMWLNEQTILQTVTRYLPQQKFNGWTECFTDDVLPLL